MYDKIINPVTNKPVKLNSNLGKKILKNYKKLFQQKGGSNFVSSLSLKNSRFDNYQYGGTLPNNPEHEVLNRSITINAHGEFSDTIIKVPEGIEILLPHIDGHTQPYTTPSVVGIDSYEEKLYKDGYFNYSRERPSGPPSGWKLYRPDDEISNMTFTPLDTTRCSIVEDKHVLQFPLIKHPTCKTGRQTYNPWCPLYAAARITDYRGSSTYTKLTSPDNKDKLKIKCCHRFTLLDVMRNLRDRLREIKAVDNNISPDPDSDKNIVIIIFTCNAYPNGHPLVWKEHDLHVLNTEGQKSMGSQYNELLGQYRDPFGPAAAASDPHPAAASVSAPADINFPTLPNTFGIDLWELGVGDKNSQPIYPAPSTAPSLMPDNLSSLTIKDLKEHLNSYGVDYSTAIERKDLVKALREAILSSLTIKDLKEHLHSYGVDYSTAIEREDLVKALREAMLSSSGASVPHPAAAASDPHPAAAASDPHPAAASVSAPASTPAAAATGSSQHYSLIPVLEPYVPPIKTQFLDPRIQEALNTCIINVRDMNELMRNPETRTQIKEATDTIKSAKLKADDLYREMDDKYTRENNNYNRQNSETIFQIIRLAYKQTLVNLFITYNMVLAVKENRPLQTPNQIILMIKIANNINKITRYIQNHLKEENAQPRDVLKKAFEEGFNEALKAKSEALEMINKHNFPKFGEFIEPKYQELINLLGILKHRAQRGGGISLKELMKPRTNIIPGKFSLKI